MGIFIFINLSYLETGLPKDNNTLSEIGCVQSTGTEIKMQDFRGPTLSAAREEYPDHHQLL